MQVVSLVSRVHKETVKNGFLAFDKTGLEKVHIGSAHGRSLVSFLGFSHKPSEKSMKFTV